VFEVTVTVISPTSGWLRGALAGAALALVAAFLLSSPAPAAAAKCANQNANPGSFGTAAAERSVFCLLNRERIKHDVPKLDRHRLLDKPSAKHSKLMVRDKCFEHECPGEADLGDRLAKYLGDSGGGWGENIAYGTGEFGTPRHIVNSWMKSEGHRRNILDADFEDIGVGIVWGTPNPKYDDGGTFTTDFGYRAG
jgi:uncharacterized protein YkwD